MLNSDENKVYAGSDCAVFFELDNWPDEIKHATQIEVVLTDVQRLIIAKKLATPHIDQTNYPNFLHAAWTGTETSNWRGGTVKAQAKININDSIQIVDLFIQFKVERSAFND